MVTSGEVYIVDECEVYKATIEIKYSRCYLLKKIDDKSDNPYIWVKEENILLNEKDSCIAKLEEENAKLQEQLKNSIVVKFEYGQTVYIIDKQFNCIFDKIYIGENKDKIILSSKFYKNYHQEIEKKYVFATEVEAQKYLESRR